MIGYLRGLGLWSPRYADVESWLSDRPSEASKPDVSLLPSALRRRSSLLTRMCAAVVQQAAQSGGADLSRCPILVSSVWGEITTTCELLNGIAARQPMSPTAFHNSVHNTATGYLSIATGSRCPAGAIAAGDAGLAMGLWELLGSLQVEPEGILVIADEGVPEPYGAAGVQPLALAFHVGRDRHESAVRLALRHSGGGPELGLVRGLSGNPAEVAFPLLRAAATRRYGPVPLTPPPPYAGGVWVAELAP